MHVQDRVESWTVQDPVQNAQ